MLLREMLAATLHTALVVAVLMGGTLHMHGQDQVPASADQICPLKVGTKIPATVLAKIDGSSFDLTAAVSRKPTVLIFYRGGW